MIEIESLPALKRFLEEHEATPYESNRAFEFYAKGQEDDLKTWLEAVRCNGELLMIGVGNPCEEVPTDAEPASALADAPEEDAEEEEMTAEDLAEYDAHCAEIERCRQGDEWKGEDYETPWEKQGEEWRGEG